MKKAKIIIPILSVIISLYLIFTTNTFFRLDLTQEKKFSLSQSSKSILKNIDDNIQIKLYLAGELDANMTQLKYAIKNKVSDLNSYANNNIKLEEIDPNEAASDNERYANYKKLETRGLKGMSIALKNKNGGITQTVVFPWMEVMHNGDTLPICMINPENNIAPIEAVKHAIEDLEYQIVDAIRVLTNDNITKIAFIEGHGELNEMETYSISETLSRYFQVDRGTIGGQPGILNDYKAIIIANPTDKFSEQDKFIIDQYIMNGGSVFWSIDGVIKSDSLLSQSGLTPVIATDLNLNDMFFKYGFRISGTIIQDLQCAHTPINIARIGERPKFETIPWYYSPLLNTSPYHPITKNRGEVMGDFVSALEFPGDTMMIKKEIILISGNASRVTTAPAEIDIDRMMNINPEEYFIHGFVPAAAILSGRFTSLYENRMHPIGIHPSEKIIQHSNKSKMIVVSDGSIMQNKIEPQDGGIWIVPLGYDRSTKRSYGNSDFILNSILYLTDQDGLMELRKREIPLRLLNTALVQQNASMIKTLNVGLPLLLLLLCGCTIFLLRKKKYN